MREYDKTNKYDIKDAARLQAPDWMLDTLALNPDYVSWGPNEDYMWNEKGGWNSQIFVSTFSDLFNNWQLNDLNEVVNFYFSIDRSTEICKVCDGSGKNLDYTKLDKDWYGFENPENRWCDKLVQEEVDALWEEGRLNYKFKEKPTAELVNKQATQIHDAINRWICVEVRAKRLGISTENCPVCDGAAEVYTEPHPHLQLTLWVLHPRKGASRGVRVMDIKKEEIPEVVAYLKHAALRNADRFSGLDNWKEK